MSGDDNPNDIQGMMRKQQAMDTLSSITSGLAQAGVQGLPLGQGLALGLAQANNVKRIDPVTRMLQLGQLGALQSDQKLKEEKANTERTQRQNYFGIPSMGSVPGFTPPTGAIPRDQLIPGLSPTSGFPQGINELPRTPAGQVFPGTSALENAPEALRPFLRAMDPDKGLSVLASLEAKKGEQGFAREQQDRSFGQQEKLQAGQQGFTGQQNSLNRQIEMAKMGRAQDQQGFTRANTLRDEFNTLTKDFRTVQDAYSKIKATSDTGAGDMSLLYSYVKLLDPGSVVRESEFATAAASGSYGERIQGLVQRIVTGERLPKSLREEFKIEAETIYQAQKRGFDTTQTNYKSLAERHGVKSEDVIQDYSKSDVPRTSVVPPKIGEVKDGYRFKGGDPADPKNWEAQ